MSDRTRINKGDNEVESDAAPESFVEGNQVTPKDDAVADFNVLRKSSTHTQKKAAVDRNAAVEQTRTSLINLNDFLLFFPNDLREEYVDILIIHADDDLDAAKQLQNFIVQKVKFCKHFTPQVALLKDISSDYTCLDLDYANSRSQYIFLYVTKEFCDDFVKLSQSHSFLLRALRSPEESKIIIPVHTKSRQMRQYRLPMMLESLRTLNYFDKTFFEDVANLLDYKSNIILEKRYNLMKEREKYFNKNYDKLMSDKRHREELLLFDKQSLHCPESHLHEKLQNSTSDDDETKVKKVDAGIQRHMSQNSFSSERKLVNDSEKKLSFIEQDGDTSGQSMNLKQNVQQSYKRTYDPLVNINNITNESSYNTPEVKVSMANKNSRSHPESDDGDFVAEPSSAHSPCAQAAFHYEKSTSNIAIRPAPVYHIHINHAGTVAINSKVNVSRKDNTENTDDTNDGDFFNTLN